MKTNILDWTLILDEGLIPKVDEQNKKWISSITPSNYMQSHATA